MKTNVHVRKPLVTSRFWEANWKPGDVSRHTGLLTCPRESDRAPGREFNARFATNLKRQPKQRGGGRDGAVQSGFLGDPCGIGIS